MGLSHFRSLLWKPWPQLELQSDHSDHVDHPPLTVVKDKVGVHFSPGKKYRNLVLLHWYFSFRRSTSIFGLFDLQSVLQHWVIFNTKKCKKYWQEQVLKKTEELHCLTNFDYLSLKKRSINCLHLISSKLTSVFWPFCQQFSRDLIIKAQSTRNNTVNLLCQIIFAIKVMACLGDSCS